MKEFNFSFQVTQAMERAYYMAQTFETEELQTFQVLTSLLLDSNNTIVKAFLEQGMILGIEELLNDVLNVPDLYEKITGKKYPIAQENLKENKVEEQNEEQKEQKIEANIHITVDYAYEVPRYYNIKYSEKLRFAIEDAYNRCKNAGMDIIDADNLLFSILCDENNSACTFLKECDVNVEELKEILEYNADIYEENKKEYISIPKLLENCCEILNDKYSKGEKCEILKREQEIFKVWSVCSKKTKRNAILVGDAGVGKTAIVEAITIQIVNGKCPKQFKNCKVILLDLNAMVAGTKYRGEFEKKVETFIKFLSRHSNVIIFVDEIHQIMGAGAAEGSGPDLSGSLKPILARDDVIFIGSTTNQEYERYFSRDPAFKRRFEKIEVKEPKISEVKAMIRLRTHNISKYHGVDIPDELIDYIIITAKAMNYEANNPDLSVDLIDRSMAIAKMRNSKVLERKDVDKVYSKNYERFKKIRKTDKLSTAYHEAGHTLLRLLSKEDARDDVKIISIIPTEEYMGVTISEENDSNRPITRKAVLEKASMALAGRVAQEYVNKDWDFGASSDLVNATEIIRKMIVEMGMDTNIYTNISLYNYGEAHNMSPAALDQVNKRIQEIMKDVYENTKILLDKNKEALDIIVDLLMQRGIISIKEINTEFKAKDIKLKK